jgi:FkbM family methyltransferase
MAKIFLDVGGYHGHSAMAGLDPRFGFDRVYCFEPVRSCYDVICKRLSNPRLTVINAGLLDRTATLPIYHAGTLGGSVFADAPDTGGGKEQCNFIKASDFFSQNIGERDSVWMKLNCEGAECDILENLFESGECRKLTEVLLDIDARKIPSAHPKMARLQNRLEHAPFSYLYPEEAQYEMVTNYGGIRNWLVVTGAIERGSSAFLKSLVYQGRAALNREVNGYYKIRALRALRLRPPASIPTKAGALRGRRSAQLDGSGAL